MTIKPITDAQKAILNAASGGGKSRASLYPQPAVQPVDAFGVLHPDTTGVDNVEIVVDYDGMPNNDILRFYWNGDLSIPAVVADTKPKRVSVPAALVIAAANKTINVIYSVIDDNNPDGVPSDVHLQVIEKYTPPVYPSPVITEAVNGVLDVGALTKNANVTVAAWPGIAVGQKIWLSMVSTPPVTLTKWVGFPITHTGNQSTTITLDKLKTLSDGSTIELHFEVSFDGGLTRVPFPAATYTIKQAQVEVRPVINAVTGPSGPVGDGSSTTDTLLVIAGTGTPSGRILIQDEAGSRGEYPINAEGDWTTSSLLFAVSTTAYSVTAKGVGGNLTSVPWRFTVQQATPPLVIDTTPVTLSGLAYVWIASHGFPLPATPADGTYVQRTATGGTPPYTYRSSSPTVASVSSTGLVRALMNGSTAITVRDAAGQEKSYSVGVTNVWRLEYIGDFIFNGAVQYQRPGGHLPSGAELQSIRVHYLNSWPYGQRTWWSSDQRNIDALVVGIPDGSATYVLKAFSNPALSVYR